MSIPGEIYNLLGYMPVPEEVALYDLDIDYIKSHFVASANEAILADSKELQQWYSSWEPTDAECRQDIQGATEKGMVFMTRSVARMVRQEYGGDFVAVYAYRQQYLNWRLEVTAVESLDDAGKAV